MCGRYTQIASWSELAGYFRLLGPPQNVQARYNIAPTQEAPVVRLDVLGERELVNMRWSLVPSWSKGPDSRYSMINARAETVTTKPAYRSAFRLRRCLVPASGFYEWKALPDGKQPYYITPKDRSPLAFAGLWEQWKGGEGQDPITSFTIIVTEANAVAREIHDRMPVILAPADFDRWLSGTNGENLLKPTSDDLLEAFPVSRRVNTPNNIDDSLVVPLPA